MNLIKMKSFNKKEKLTIAETKKLLREKTSLLAMWECESELGQTYKTWYPALVKLFKEVLLFDPRLKKFEFGPEYMKKKILEVISKNKPDYVFISYGAEETNIQVIEGINKISPHTKVIIFSSDDNACFYEIFRYISFFADCVLVGQPDYLSAYKKEGFTNALPFFITDTETFRPLSVSKKYDLSFVGHPNPPRVELLNFLIQNGIKVNIWGKGWDDYDEFRNFYKGPLKTEDFVKCINETKINLGFTKSSYGPPHFKGRILEVGACKSFQLVDYFGGYLKYFKEGEEIIMFKNKEELLKNIKYYLSNEEEREKIADKMYKKIVANHDIANSLAKSFQEILQNDNSFSRKTFPKIDKKIFSISEKDVGDVNKMKSRVKSCDYLKFSFGENTPLQYKDIFQVYSLEKTKKEISCCDSYIHSKLLGRSMRFRSLPTLKILNEEKFHELLNINQLMVSKKYFLENIDTFLRVFKGDKLDFVSKENTVFVSIPLIQIESYNKKAINRLDPKSLDSAFQLNFLMELYSKMYQRKILNSYLYGLFVESIFYNNKYLLKYLINSFFSKEKWSKLMEKE